MLNFYYGSPYFWGKVVLTKFISGCRMVWDLICGTSWFYKSKTEKVTVGGMSAILPNWCCLLSITVLFTQPCLLYISFTKLKTFHLNLLFFPHLRLCIFDHCSIRYHYLETLFFKHSHLSSVVLIPEKNICKRQNAGKIFLSKLRCR